MTLLQYIGHHPAEYISIKFTNFNVSQSCCQGPSLPWSYFSWIYNYYLCNHCLSPLMLWVRISIVDRCTTLCDQVCQWLETGRWFSPGTPVYSNAYIQEEQTIQWPKEKVQKDKLRSTKHTHKTTDRVTRTSLKTGGELRFSGRVFVESIAGDVENI
jgi:hypothetical protein